MKRMLRFLLLACIACFCLTACNSNSTASYNITDVSIALETVAAIENPTAFTQDDLIYDMNIDPEMVEEFTGIRTLTNGKPGAVLVLKAATGQAETLKTQLESYRDGIVATWENYKADFPIGYEQTVNGRVVLKSDYVVLAIAGEGVDYADIDKAIDEAMK